MRPPEEAALVLHPSSPRDDRLRGPDARLEEAVGLALALDLQIVGAEIVPLRGTTPATLFGKGKVAELGALCAERDIHVVVVDSALTPVQQRNLEKAWQAKVIDRTGLILEIFARRARTREGRLQVELARLAYERSRLVRTWTHLERQRGGFGVMGGPGETQIETDRRLLAGKIARLKQDLAEVRRTRGLQRRARKRAPAPTIALVGYTNAGKSTLFNRLTESEVEAKDMLFATLDPTMRAVRLPQGRPAILSDTVGFISDLPHELVEAFRATLEEVAEADVVVHVRDIAGPDSEAQAADVRKVLEQIGVGAGLPAACWSRCGTRWTWSTPMSGTPRWPGPPAPASTAIMSKDAGRPGFGGSGEGIAKSPAGDAGRADRSGERWFTAELPAPGGDGKALAWLYRHGRIVDRSDAEDGSVRLSVRLDHQALGRFERLFPEALMSHAAE